MRKTIVWLAFIIIILAAGYFLFGQSSGTPAAPTVSNGTTTVQNVGAQNTPAQAPDQGATSVSNPEAPKGSAAACAQCDQYSGAQRAECLVALNC